jgi:hypothetical protein
VLCDSMEVRDTLVLAGSVSTDRCSLAMAPWSRQVGAFLRDTPFLAQLDIRGIPAHAWAERTAIKLLEGCGIVDAVDPSTANRNDMSVFRVDVWTHDVAAIPVVRWLAVPEPGYGNKLEVSDGRCRPRSDLPKVLWYRIRFHVRSWLVGSVPASGESDSSSGGARDAGGPRDGGSDAAGGAGNAQRRRRRRRGPRRRRGHAAAAPQDGEAVQAASTALALWLLPLRRASRPPLPWRLATWPLPPPAARRRVGWMPMSRGTVHRKPGCAPLALRGASSALTLAVLPARVSTGPWSGARPHALDRRALRMTLACVARRPTVMGLRLRPCRAGVNGPIFKLLCARPAVAVHVMALAWQETRQLCQLLKPSLLGTARSPRPVPLLVAAHFRPRTS